LKTSKKSKFFFITEKESDYSLTALCILFFWLFTTTRAVAEVKYIYGVY